MTKLPVIFTTVDDPNADQIRISQWGKARLIVSLPKPGGTTFYVRRNDTLVWEMPPTEASIENIDALIEQLSQLRDVLNLAETRELYAAWEQTREERLAELERTRTFPCPVDEKQHRYFVSKHTVTDDYPIIHGMSTKDPAHPEARMYCGMTKFKNCIEFPTLEQLRATYPSARFCIQCGM